MKKIQFWSLLLGLTFGSLAFTACSNDDDDSGDGGNTPPPAETEITGTWKIDLTTKTKTYDNVEAEMTYSETMEFNADGTFQAQNTFTDYQQSSTKYEGVWKKLGTDKVVVELKSKVNIDDKGTPVPDPYFKAHNDTLGYFFKGNAVFCESVVNSGYFAYTRDGKLPFSGYSDYSNNPIVGSWIGEDFAWDGTPITNRLELRTDGTYIQTMDNHQGWSEGMAGYYILDGNRMMLISYYFISKMDSQTNDWEVVGYRMWGGVWNEFSLENDNNILRNSGADSMGEMPFMVREGKQLGTSFLGKWYNNHTLYDGKNTPEDEYWVIENTSIKHWWVTNGQFREGAVGTYSTTTRTDQYTGNEVTVLVCHWNNWLVDSGDNLNPAVGQETGRGESDYEVPYVYSKVSDVLLTQWPNQYGNGEYLRFKRMK